MSLQKNVVNEPESFKSLLKYAIGLQRPSAIGLFLKRRDFEGKVVRWLLQRGFRFYAMLVYVATKWAAEGPS